MPENFFCPQQNEHLPKFLLEIVQILERKQISATKRYANLCIEHKSSLVNRVMGGI